jgi:hypothetical protein
MPKGGSATKKIMSVNKFCAQLAKPGKKRKKTRIVTASTGMKSRMQKAGVPLRCAITGFKLKTGTGCLEAAQIFPDCWIQDGSFKTRLDGFLPPPKNGWKKLLDSPANRIILRSDVHTLFDSRSADAANVGTWTLVPKIDASGNLVPGTYIIVVKKADKTNSAMVGIKDNAEVSLPHVDVRLLQWHNAQFGARAPTAGADVSDSDSFFDDDDDIAEDPLKRENADELLYNFLKHAVIPVQ